MQKTIKNQNTILTRRQFLAAASAFGAMSAFGSNAKPILRFGLITDVHYADAETRGTRHYRDSLRKTGECVSVMNQERVDFLAELGDFKDQTAPKEETTLQYLRAIEREFSRFDGPRYHALGNHDMDSISKKQFLANVENTGVSSERSYYSFECKGVRFIVLDANFRKDGIEYERGNFDWTDANVPSQELDWLRGELKADAKPVIAFIHQLLDGEGNVYVKNAEEVRGVLEESGKVLAVFRGTITTVNTTRSAASTTTRSREPLRARAAITIPMRLWKFAPAARSTLSDSERRLAEPTFKSI